MKESCSNSRFVSCAPIQTWSLAVVDRVALNHTIMLLQLHCSSSFRLRHNLSQMGRLLMVSWRYCAIVMTLAVFSIVPDVEFEPQTRAELQLANGSSSRWLPQRTHEQIPGA